MGLSFSPSTYYAAIQVRDQGLREAIERVWQENYQVYGARKVWRQPRREGVTVARCTVERLMRELGLKGARQGRPIRTTRSDPRLPQPGDLLRGDFTAAAPNTTWVVDLTYIPLNGATVYAAFVVDLFARMIVGWRLADHHRAGLSLNALNMAL